MGTNLIGTHATGKNTMRKKRNVTPLLLTPREVKKMLGRVPRGLTNMVVSDPKGRKLFRLGEVLQYVDKSN